MKKLMKSFAMFTLSACLLMGGVLSSFAAGAPAIAIQSHKGSSCGGTGNAEIVAQFTDAKGKAESYTLCVYQGEVAGQRVMTVACLGSAGSAIKDLEVNVMMPRYAVEGYDLYQVNLDGSETKLEIGGDARWAYVDVFMAEGAALVRMVPQA